MAMPEGHFSMKIPVLVAALIASVALASPAEAATKKRGKGAQRAPAATVQVKPNGSYDVYVGNELAGRDPDPFIRSMMRRSHPGWDGPE
jgi:hypothetical protein